TSLLAQLFRVLIGVLILLAVVVPFSYARGGVSAVEISLGMGLLVTAILFLRGFFPFRAFSFFILWLSISIGVGITYVYATGAKDYLIAGAVPGVLGGISMGLLWGRAHPFFEAAKTFLLSIGMFLLMWLFFLLFK